jgi:hypothetical protein
MLFAFKWNQLKRQGVNLERRFKELPQE